ncbi:hypothetical protein SLEP1_g59291, partial [Rubroshorea leprosula]
MPLFNRKGPSGFSGSSTAEEVTQGIDGTGLTAIVTVWTAVAERNPSAPCCCCCCATALPQLHHCPATAAPLSRHYSATLLLLKVEVKVDFA